MTSTNGGRIGRVKFKNGAEVRILESRNTGEPDVIELLLNLLGRARNGQLVAFAMVSVSPNGTVGTAWANGDGSHHHELASGSLTLANRIGGS